MTKAELAITIAVIATLGIAVGALIALSLGILR
jgi:hypothetical protein